MIQPQNLPLSTKSNLKKIINNILSVIKYIKIQQKQKKNVLRGTNVLKGRNHHDHKYYAERKKRFSRFFDDIRLSHL